MLQVSLDTSFLITFADPGRANHAVAVDYFAQVITFTGNGAGAAAALDAFTGTLSPFAPTLANGEPNILALFATGLGADATDGGGNVASSTRAFINGLPATVAYAGRAPGLIGLNQLNIVLPAGLASGAQRLRIGRNGLLSNETTIVIR